MKTFKFLYIVAAALSFAACANEDEGMGDNGPVAATVHADRTKSLHTRGTADNDSWTQGDTIGVYVTSQGNTTGTNVKYEATDNAGNFISANPIYFRDNEVATFSAYYPYEDNDHIDEDGWLKTPWTIDYTDPGKTVAYDFLFASGATASKASPSVNFMDLNDENESLPEKDHRFKHKMSMIAFKIVADESIDGRANNLQSIELDKICNQGRVNVKTGAIETTGNPELRLLSVNSFLNQEITCQFILFPQKLANNTLTVGCNVQSSYDQSTNTYKADLVLPAKGFEGGKKYIYTIVVSNRNIVIENNQIGKWESGAESNLDAELDQTNG